MSNSVSITQAPSVAERAVAHFNESVPVDLNETILGMAAIMNRARGNVAAAQAHLNIFRITRNRTEFGAFIVDWGQLDFDVFAALLEGTRTIYRAFGAHPLDDRRQTLTAIRNAVRAADDTDVVTTREYIENIRGFVAEIAVDTEDPQVIRLAQEINGHLTHLEEAVSRRYDRGEPFAGAPQARRFWENLGRDDPYAPQKLARTMLADAQKRDKNQRDERQKQQLENEREKDYQDNKYQDIKRYRDRQAVQAQAAVRAT
ncbi:MAG: hypothetical protein LBB26_01270 [Puniceicoccales bacterium]|jgi:hypothetical protein|nr:hypothetical protein [Puniceicoccales bacterium]